MLLKKKINIPIKYKSDAYYACNKAKDLFLEIGGKNKHALYVVTATSELTNNILKHADHGTLLFESFESEGKLGIKITSLDEGPGITNWEDAIVEGFSTKKTLGLGLSGIITLMDNVVFDEDRKIGTKIIAKKFI